MIRREKLNEFLEDCISSGKVVKTDAIDLDQKTILEIEDILYKCNDSKARRKIKVILKSKL